MKEIFKNKKIILTVIFFIIISIIMIVLAVISLLNRPKQSSNAPTKSYDQASQKEITTFTGYTPNVKEPMYAGFEKFYHGYEWNAFTKFQDMMNEFAKKESGNKYDRISLYKDSLNHQKKEGINIWITFKIAINNDQKDYYVKIDKKSYFNYDIILYNDKDMKDEVYKYHYCDPSVCKDDKAKNNKAQN